MGLRDFSDIRNLDDCIKVELFSATEITYHADLGSKNMQNPHINLTKVVKDLSKVYTRLKKEEPFLKSLKEKTIHAYSSKIVEKIDLLLSSSHNKTLEQEMNDFKVFFEDNWLLIKGTLLSYTKLALHDISILLRELAQQIVETANKNSDSSILQIQIQDLLTPGHLEQFHFTQYEQILPKLIENVLDMTKFISQNELEVDILCDALREKMPRLLKENKDFGTIIEAFGTKAAIFLSALAENLPELIKNPSHLIHVLKHLDEKAILKLLKDYSHSSFHLFTKIEDFIRLMNESSFAIYLKKLPLTERQRIVDNIAQDLSFYILTEGHLKQALKNLKLKHHKFLFERLGNRLKMLIKDEQLKLIFENSDFEHHKEILFITHGLSAQNINHNFDSSTSNYNHFGLLLNKLPTERLRTLLPMLQDCLPTIIKRGDGLGPTLFLCTPFQTKLLLGFMQGNLLELIKNSSDLRNELRELSPENCFILLTFMVQQLPDLLSDYFNFFELANKLCVAQLEKVVEALPHLFPELLQKEPDLFKKTKELYRLCSKRYDLVSKLILSHLPILLKQNSVFLQQTLAHLSHEDCKFFFKLMEPSLISLFKEDKFSFGVFLSNLTPQLVQIALETMQERLVNELIQSSFIFSHLLKILGPQKEKSHLVFKAFNSSLPTTGNQTTALEQLIKNITDLKNVLMYLNDNDKKDALKSLRNHFPKIINNGYDFFNIWMDLPTEHHQEAFHLMAPTLSQAMNSIDELILVFQAIPVELCKVFTAKIKHLELFKQSKENILNVLPENKRNAIKEELHLWKSFKNVFFPQSQLEKEYKGVSSKIATDKAMNTYGKPRSGLK